MSTSPASPRSQRVVFPLAACAASLVIVLLAGLAWQRTTLADEAGVVREIAVDGGQLLPWLVPTALASAAAGLAALTMSRLRRVAGLLCLVAGLAIFVGALWATLADAALTEYLARTLTSGRDAAGAEREITLLGRVFAIAPALLAGVGADLLIRRVSTGHPRAGVAEADAASRPAYGPPASAGSAAGQAPGEQSARSPVGEDGPRDSRAMWDALDRDEDPTDAAGTSLPVNDGQ